MTDQQTSARTQTLAEDCLEQAWAYYAPLPEKSAPPGGYDTDPEMAPVS